VETPYFLVHYPFVVILCRTNVIRWLSTYNGHRLLCKRNPTYEIQRRDDIDIVFDIIIDKREGLEYLVADCCNMSSFSDGSFNVCLDKGTIDSILTTPTAGDTLPKMLEEIKRILKKNGKYLVLCESNDRGHYFERYGWKVKLQEIQNVPSGQRNGYSQADIYHLYVIS
jgi:SAM-dependent methyltransferase